MNRRSVDSDTMPTIIRLIYLSPFTIATGKNE